MVAVTRPHAQIRLADISSLLVKDFDRATDQGARAVVTIYTLSAKL